VIAFDSRRAQAPAFDRWWLASEKCPGSSRPSGEPASTLAGAGRPQHGRRQVREAGARRLDERAARRRQAMMGEACITASTGRSAFRAGARSRPRSRALPGTAPPPRGQALEVAPGRAARQTSSSTRGRRSSGRRGSARARARARPQRTTFTSPSSTTTS
jgi:hypothetical protein